MGNTRTLDIPDEQSATETTNLEWALQFVKLKIQEMVCANSIFS